METKFGLCCICLALKERGIAYRKITARNFFSMERAEALKKVSSIWLNNAQVLNAVIEFCARNSIAHYRLPSDIFPLATLPEAGLEIANIADADAIIKLLKKGGEIAKKSTIGVSFHPSQFVVLASDKNEVRKSAAEEINFNSRIFDIMGVGEGWESPINIHINSNPNRASFDDDFDDGLSRLSAGARARLVVENEDRGYFNAENLLAILKPRAIPMTFDILHDKCNPSKIDAQAAFFAAAKTWGKYLPIFHYAESASSKLPRAHSQYCVDLPPDFGIDCVWQVEAKAKDLAITELQKIAARKSACSK